MPQLKEMGSSAGRPGQVVLTSVFAVGLVASIAAIILGAGNTTALTSIAAIMAGLLVIVAILPNVKELTVGPKGVQARMDEIDQKIDSHEEQLREQQRMINELVTYSMSSSIFHHLCGITLTTEYIYRDNPSNQREFYFLRDNGLIRPRAGSFLDFNAGLDNRNVVEIAEPTPIGWQCVRLRKEDIPSNMRADTKNLRVNLAEL